MRKSALFIALIIPFLATTGCMTAAKRVLNEAKGATSKSRTVAGGSRDKYKTYQSITVSPATSEIEPLVSQEFLRALPIELVNMLTTGDEPLFKKTGEPVLNIDSRVMWYHQPGGMGDILGSSSYTVVLYTLTSNGNALDKVQIVTKSAASRTEDGDMAKSSAEELIKWFEARGKGEYEEDEEKKQQEEADRERRENQKDDEDNEDEDDDED
jgi:hypothetical protein